MKAYISKESLQTRQLAKVQGFFDSEIEMVSGLVEKVLKVQNDAKEVADWLYKIEGIYAGRADASTTQTLVSKLEIPKCLVGEAPSGQRRSEQDTVVDSNSALQQPRKKKASSSSTSRKKAKSSGPRKKKSTSPTSSSPTASSSNAKDG